MNKYNLSKSAQQPTVRRLKIYAELIRNYKNQEIKSFWDNNFVHAASKAYDYSGFGDTPILVIINPMDVLAVPHNEDGKLRTCRWFFASVLDNKEEHILDDEDFDVKDLGDVFEEQCLKDMQGYVQNSFAEEVKRHTFQLPEITAKEISNIVLTLEEMKNKISNRVKNYEY